AVFPQVDDLVHIQALDLLGNGTACLVWSSPLPGDAGRQMRYVRLMAEKPHLLVKTVNNLGAETRVHYAPSIKFYLQDKRDGKPWITRLPFPVHVVERVETYDHISRNRFVTRYAYHHGYFDGEEREFRGFGMVEQWDTEAFEDYVVGVQRIEGAQELAPELYQPPVTTRTWYHTGALLDHPHVLHQYRHEYYRQEQFLPEPVLPPDLSAAELRECVRALKGLPLRQEIYGFDGSPEEQHPYTVTENSFEIRRLQPRGNQRHGVFFAVGRESISLNYERNPTDPRISHTLGLELDEYGNARKSCSVVYGRKIADPSLPTEVTQDQQKRYITYTETDYTPDIEQAPFPEAHRLRVPFESRVYEITGIAPENDLFELEDIKAKIDGATPIDYEVIADGVTAQKRLLSHSRTIFLDNTLNPLPLGHWDSLGLTYQSYDLAFTPAITAAHYAGKVSDAEFAAAGYVHFNDDANWWIPSGTAIYPTDARSHFY
ncbi:MAG: toxin, partial [Candidatus Zixiibacteriota bacterium]